MAESIITKICSISDCGRKMQARGWCLLHYNKLHITGKVCSVEGCGRGGKIVRGWCNTHYVRWKNDGHPGEAGSRHLLGIGDTPEERFWSRVNKTDGCWLWLGCTQKGYGAARFNNKMEQTHRLAWFYTYGKMPSMWLLHSCDVPLCCNPAHLREGTPADNSRDMVSRSRQAKGELLPQAKLTSADVLAIRDEYAKGGVSQVTLGERYGVGNMQISRIVRRERWSHI